MNVLLSTVLSQTVMCLSLLWRVCSVIGVRLRGPPMDSSLSTAVVAEPPHTGPGCITQSARQPTSQLVSQPIRLPVSKPVSYPTLELGKGEALMRICNGSLYSLYWGRGRFQHPERKDESLSLRGLIGVGEVRRGRVRGRVRAGGRG